MKQEIMDCFTWYANKVAETVQYESWSNEFCSKDTRYGCLAFGIVIEDN